jgi:hypothetical protein
MSALPETVPAPGAVQCSYHPDVETRLRCSRCGKPICPRCAVRTPVGLRCPDCAGTRASIAANPAGTAKAAAAGFAVATLVAIAWGFFPAWGFYWALALGFGVVETMARLLRGRTGADLQAIAMAIIAYGAVLSRVVILQRLGVDPGAITELSRAVQGALYLRPVPDLLFVALALAIGWIRFR